MTSDSELSIVLQTGDLSDNSNNLSHDHASIQWQIKDFSLYPAEVDGRIRSPRFSSSDAIWELWLYPNGQKELLGKISISLIRYSSDRRKHTVKCGIGLKGKNSTVYQACTFEGVINKTGSSEIVSRVLDRSELMEEKREIFLPYDTLTVWCKLEIERETVNGSMRQYDYICSLDNLSDDIGNLFRNKKNCDVILKANGTEFLAHKLILAARSPVFAEMFEQDVDGKYNNVVDIPDMDANVLHSFLSFIYFGEIFSKSMDNAIKLFVAADKYTIGSLKTKCVDVISRNLSVDKVCDVAILGDTYGDARLEDSVKRFLRSNMLVVAETKSWHALFAERPRLAANLMQAAFLNKW